MNGDYPSMADLDGETQRLAPPPDEKEESAEIGIIRELSPKKILEQLRMKMKGYEWDPVEDKYIKIKGMEPLMNDKGISKYLSIMSSVITDLVTFGYYKEDEIKHLVQYVCDKAIPTIHINYKEYGITDKCDLQIIDIQIFTLTYAAFKKAVGAGDRNVIRGTISESISKRSPIMPSGYQQNESMLSRLNPFRRKM